MSDCRLTTFDNPFDPFNEFSYWFMYDVQQGYNTCSYLARIAQTTDDMSDKELDEENERAIDAIIDNDFQNIYKKVYRNDSKVAKSELHTEKQTA